MALIYIAQFRYGAANLASFEVERETDKIVFVLPDSRKNIIGHVFSGRLFRKNSGNVFHTLPEALVYLHDKLSEHITRLYDEQDAARAQRDSISEMLEQETQ